MSDLEELEALFLKHGYTDYKWIDPRSIIVSQWVRMKCMFGCGGYGRDATCPPNVPTVSECRRFFEEYSTCAIFHFAKAVEKPEDRFSWSRQINKGLAALEREVFLSGYRKTFMLVIDSCTMCKECTGEREECRNPRTARPSPEAMAVDVYATVRQHGYPVQVLTDFSQTMNRYGFLLVE